MAAPKRKRVTPLLAGQQTLFGAPAAISNPPAQSSRHGEKHSWCELATPQYLSRYTFGLTYGEMAFIACTVDMQLLVEAELVVAKYLFLNHSLVLDLTVFHSMRSLLHMCRVLKRIASGSYGRRRTRRWKL